MSTNQMPAKEWLLLNACECWLHYFPNHKWAPTYKELKEELMQQLLNKTKDEPQPAVKETPKQTRRPVTKPTTTKPKP